MVDFSLILLIIMCKILSFGISMIQYMVNLNV